MSCTSSKPASAVPRLPEEAPRAPDPPPALPDLDPGDAGDDAKDGGACTEKAKKMRSEVAIERTRAEVFGEQRTEHAEPVVAAYVDACQICCSDAARAKLWTYVAYVHRFERHNVASAERAFEKALRLDSRVELDPQIQRDEKLSKAFARRRAALGLPGVAEEADAGR